MAEEFKKTIEFRPAYDKRQEGYGIHGVEIIFVMVGDKGAVQFILYTHWNLPHVEKELDAKYTDHLFCHPLPADIGYHSPTPLYEGQCDMGPCPHLGGKNCYYDGSGLMAINAYERLLNEGHDGVWSYLEDFYNSKFGEGVRNYVKRSV